MTKLARKKGGSKRWGFVTFLSRVLVTIWLLKKVCLDCRIPVNKIKRERQEIYFQKSK